ncbi:MAG: hypothetical protein KHW88_03870 [Lachnospiraceae bacterium]|nr:hypothetical protein [Lachnospiraceae bacterium]
MILSSMASKFSFSISVFIIFIIPRYENIATKETILTRFVIFLSTVSFHPLLLHSDNFQFLC